MHNPRGSNDRNCERNVSRRYCCFFRGRDRVRRRSTETMEIDCSIRRTMLRVATPALVPSVRRPVSYGVA
jgi:hypothetical protein